MATLSVRGTNAVLHKRPVTNKPATKTPATKTLAKNTPATNTPATKTPSTMTTEEKAEREKEWVKYSTTNTDYLLIKPTNPKFTYIHPAFKDDMKAQWLAEDKAKFMEYKKPKQATQTNPTKKGQEELKKEHEKMYTVGSNIGTREYGGEAEIDQYFSNIFNGKQNSWNPNGENSKIIGWVIKAMYTNAHTIIESINKKTFDSTFIANLKKWINIELDKAKKLTLKTELAPKMGSLTITPWADKKPADKKPGDQNFYKKGLKEVLTIAKRKKDNKYIVPKSGCNDPNNCDYDPTATENLYSSCSAEEKGYNRYNQQLRDIGKFRKLMDPLKKKLTVIKVKYTQRGRDVTKSVKINIMACSSNCANGSKIEGCAPRSCIGWAGSAEEGTDYVWKKKNGKFKCVRNTKATKKRKKKKKGGRKSRKKRKRTRKKKKRGGKKSRKKKRKRKTRKKKKRRS